MRYLLALVIDSSSMWLVHVHLYNLTISNKQWQALPVCCCTVTQVMTLVDSHLETPAVLEGRIPNTHPRTEFRTLSLRKGDQRWNQRWCLDPAKTENSEWTAIYLDRKTLVGSLHVSTTKPSIWEKYRPLVLGRLAVATKRDKQFGAPMSCLHLRIFTIPFRAIISPASQRLDEGRQREKGENERHVGEIKSGRLPNKAQWT